MLKLNYNDYGLFLEQVTASIDAFATQRVILAVYAGETLHIEPGRAAFLLASNTPGVAKLRGILQNNATSEISLTAVETNYIELSFQRTSIAFIAQAQSAPFVTTLTPEIEALVCSLWQATQRLAACAA